MFNKSVTLNLNMFDDNGNEFEIEVNYYPGRLAPPCASPDSLSFGDGGDPADVDILSATYIEDDLKGKLVPEEILDELLDDIYDECDREYNN